MLIANVGIPLVCVTLPMMLFALIPIALVEAIVLNRYCLVRFKEAWWASLYANFWSTLVGIPIAWLPFCVIQMIVTQGYAPKMETPLDQFAATTIHGAWIAPVHGQQTSWIIAGASLTMLIPCFFASVWIEQKILRSRWGATYPELLKGVVLGNLATYLLLAGYYLVMLLISR